METNLWKQRYDEMVATCAFTAKERDEALAELKSARNQRDEWRLDAGMANEYIKKLGKMLGCEDGETTPELQIEAMNAQIVALREALEALQNWQTDAVLGNGEYDQGLMCGVEDRGYQTDGYSAMRYGYDRAIERVSEEIDGQIEAALALNLARQENPLAAMHREADAIREKGGSLELTSARQ